VRDEGEVRSFVLFFGLQPAFYKENKVAQQRADDCAVC